MIARAPIIFVLLVTVLATESTAEVVYALVSPNEQSWGYFGDSVSGAGDVNGDGYDDVVVGARYEDPGASPTDAGRVHIFDGHTGRPLRTLVSPNEEFHGYFGISVSGAGDVNGDDYADVVIGAFLEDPGASPTDAGRAYVFDGQKGTPLHTLVSPNEQEDGWFGNSVSGAGDVNGDGHDDVVVGAEHEDPGSSPNNSGRAYVFDGQKGTPLHTLVSPNEQEDGWFGESVSGAGDVNGDGHDDVVIGALMESPGSSPDCAGRAYVFDGQTGAVLHTLVSPNEQGWGSFGESVSGAGDVNGDGYHDVVVGTAWEEPGSSPTNAGRAYVFDGPTGILLHTLVSPNEETEGQFGWSVSGAGDVTGDGYDDVVIGARSEDPGASPNGAGRAYVFNGQTGTALHTLVSPNETWHGVFGCSVSGVGDTNGDGYHEVVVGAHTDWSSSGLVSAGRAYVFSWMHLLPSLAGNALQLEWSTWLMASEYWIYGTDNLWYFVPGFAPGYAFKLDEVVPPATTWSSTNGVGAPDHNWTYIVIAVDEFDQELARSNRAGEHDFDIPFP